MSKIKIKLELEDMMPGMASETKEDASSFRAAVALFEAAKVAAETRILCGLAHAAFVWVAEDGETPASAADFESAWRGVSPHNCDRKQLQNFADGKVSKLGIMSGSDDMEVSL